MVDNHMRSAQQYRSSASEGRKSALLESEIYYRNAALDSAIVQEKTAIRHECEAEYWGQFVKQTERHSQ